MTLDEKCLAAFSPHLPDPYIDADGIKYRAIPECEAADVEASGAYVVRLPRYTVTATPDPNDRTPQIYAEAVRQTFRIVRRAPS